MNKFHLIRLCFYQRCCNETDFILSEYDTWFYTIKAIICILLNLHAAGESFDTVHVATLAVHTWHDYHNGPSGAVDFVAVDVSKKWQYALMNDGWP